MTLSSYTTSIFTLTLALFLTGCSSYGVITNAPSEATQQPTDDNYSIQSVIQAKPQGNISLALAFSGGGTRAAAFSYGVLKTLRETKLKNGKSLLDEVDIISSVSGGSFTAAYYGLHGKKTFKHFRERILMNDIEAKLIRGVINPIRWFSETGRTQLAIDYYSSALFGDKTFEDLNKPGRPLILINASDLSNGVRFSFVQEYFDFICSDIKSLPIGKAVAASTAVPVLFNPVVLKNYQPCQNGVKRKMAKAQHFAKKNIELKQAVHGISEYTDNYPFLHLVDGGITDNLGLRAIYEAVELSGGAGRFLQVVNKRQTQNMVVILVDASTQSGGLGINQSSKLPTPLQTLDAVTDIQIHRYNASTIELFKQSLSEWSQQLSAESQQTVEPDFIQVNFDQLTDPTKQADFNRTPTSLTLTEDQIDNLIAVGEDLLKSNPEFQNLLQKLNQQAEKTASSRDDK